MRSDFFRAGKILLFVSVAVLGAMLGSCAQVDVPDARNVDVPTPVAAKKRERGVNEHPDSVMYLPLGDDVLVPEIAEDDPLPYEMVGPFELRNETLAGALQLILADYDIGLAFETNAAMSRHITVTNLSGELSKVVKRVCSLANLYCSYEDGTIVVKEAQTFTVTLPPIGTSMISADSNSSSGGSGSGSNSSSSSSSSSSSGGSSDNGDYLTNVASGLEAITGSKPISDASTRTLVYSASQRTAALAERYFQRLRASTAMIVYETYIWEVQLNSGNSAGIKWDAIDKIGKYTISAGITGDVNSDFTNPISIGLPTTGNVTPTDLINFLSQFGAVKTISQPQITVLSGASAEMRVADTQNYVSEISTTFTDTQSSTSVSTDTVDSGFTLTIGSAWDKATVYTNINIEITDVLQIDNFSVTGTGDDAGTTRIQLPQTTERELNTQIRVRPGDSVLIGGLVREKDNFDTEGPGFMEPIVPKQRTAQTQNLELVIMLRPRVVVYTDPSDEKYLQYNHQKAMASASPVASYLQDAAPSQTSAPSYQAPSIAPTAPVPSAAPADPAPSVTFTKQPVVDPIPDEPVPVKTQNIATTPPPKLSAPPAYKPAAPSARRSSAYDSRDSQTDDSVSVAPLPSVSRVDSSPPQTLLAPAKPAAPTPVTPVAPAPAPASVYTPPANTSKDSNYTSPYETYDYYSPAY